MKTSIYAADVSPANGLPGINLDKDARNYDTKFYTVGGSAASSRPVQSRDPDCISNQSSINDLENTNDGDLDGALSKKDIKKLHH